MKKISLELQGSEEYLGVVGGFIRHTLFFKKKAFKFIGMSASYVEPYEPVQVSTVFGTELPQTILLKLNTLDLSYLERYVTGSIDNEYIKDFNENFESNGIKINYKKLESDMMSITIEGKIRLLKSTDLSEIIGECDEFTLYSSIEPRDVEIQLFLRYDYGYYTEEENLNNLSKQNSSEFITVGSLHKYDCNFGYTVEGGYSPKLILNVDERLEESTIKSILDLTFREIQNSFS